MKKFSFPKNMVRADVFNRFFGSFYRCGFAAFRIFRGGISSPPVAAESVPTILSIPHQSGKSKNCQRTWTNEIRRNVVIFGTRKSRWDYLMASGSSRKKFCGRRKDYPFRGQGIYQSIEVSDVLVLT